MIGETGDGPEIIHNLSFNHDGSCLVLATSRGFRVFSTQPIHLRKACDLAAPIQIAQMFGRSNLLALVGFQDTSFAANRVVLFDCKAEGVVGQASFESNVLQVKLRAGKMAVALKNRVYLLDLFTLQVDHVLPTMLFAEEEPYFRISLSNDPQNFVLACPGLDSGTLLIAFPHEQKQRRIRAHQSGISYVLLTAGGQKVATASERGMHIRVFSTATGQQLQQVRRGNEFGVIYSMAFSRCGNWLACTSDSNIVHVFVCVLTSSQKSQHYFALKQQTTCNPKSRFYCLRRFLPYFDAEYSYSRHLLTDFEPQVQTWASFGSQDDSLSLVNDYGSFRRVVLTKGVCTQVLDSTELLESP